MYVRKFIGSSLDETLKSIKKELGPDAIILKTVTNKGLKGALKKNRIEITAAISEKDYVKKSQVDVVLNSDQKSSFYKSPANMVANSIEKYDLTKPKLQNDSYGSLSLNKNVIQENDPLDIELQNFIGTDLEDSKSKIIKETVEEIELEDIPNVINFPEKEDTNNEQLKQIEQRLKSLGDLEKKVKFLMTQNQVGEVNTPKGLYQLRTYLKTVGISEKFIQHIIQKLSFEMKGDELEKYDPLYDICLREMAEQIYVSMPHFSCIENSEQGTLTLFFSNTTCGQTSTILKLASLKDKSCVICYNHNDVKTNYDFIQEVKDINVINVTNISELVSECRKGLKDKKTIFIDLKQINKEDLEVIKIYESLNNSFEKVEVLLSLSAIHSESFNRKKLEKYQNILDGIIFTHLDYLTNYGDIFNLHYDYPDIPLKFFSTGRVVPDDLEAASAERIIAGLFKL